MTKNQDNTQQTNAEIKWRPTRLSKNLNVKISSLRPGRSVDRTRSVRPQRSPLKGLIKSENTQESAED